MFGLSAKALFGIVVTLIAIVLAFVMTIVNVSKSQSEVERKYVVSACVVSWLLIAISIVLVVLIPSPYDYIPLGAIILVFPYIIYKMSIRHQLLREKERRHSERIERAAAE